MRFCAFGIIVADLIAEPVDLARLPTTLSLARLRSVSLHPGGSACNVAMALAKLSPGVAASAATAGIVGDDALGEVLIRQLQTAGVDTSGIRAIPGGQT